MAAIYRECVCYVFHPQGICLWCFPSPGNMFVMLAIPREYVSYVCYSKGMCLWRLPFPRECVCDGCHPTGQTPPVCSKLPHTQVCTQARQCSTIDYTTWLFIDYTTWFFGALQCRTDHWTALRYSAVCCIAVLHSEVKCDTVQCRIIHSRTVRYRLVQCSAVDTLPYSYLQLVAVQCSRVHCTAVKYSGCSAVQWCAF